jgi:putative membrane protein
MHSFYLSVIILFVVFAWLLSFFSTLFSYGNFTLYVKEKELIITRGIFEKKRVTVPFNRIQAVHVAQGMIRQPLGYASVHIESAGYGDESGTGSIVLFPLIRKEKILPFLNDVLPGYQKEMSGLSLPRRSLRRYLFRSAFFITVATAVLYYTLDLNNWIWLIPVLSLGWGWLKYRAAAIGMNGSAYILRSRTFSKTTAFLKKNRIQDVTVSQSLFQRWRNLCTIQVHVASGDRGRVFSVRDLEMQDGRTF